MPGGNWPAGWPGAALPVNCGSAQKPETNTPNGNWPVTDLVMAKCQMLVAAPSRAETQQPPWIVPDDLWACTESIESPTRRPDALGRESPKRLLEDLVLDRGPFSVRTMRQIVGRFLP